MNAEETKENKEGKMYFSHNKINNQNNQTPLQRNTT